MGESGPLVDPADAPPWLRTLVSSVDGLDSAAFSRWPEPLGVPSRRAAVLILFGEGPSGPDLLLLRRAESLGSHPGQVAFPGGGEECADEGLVHTALREAEEEVGVRPEGVHPLALLPGLYVAASKFLVTGVIAHWERPCPVTAVDPAETAAVARVPVDYLVAPRNRLQVRVRDVYSSPAFLFPGMLIWGFTGGIITGLLRLGGWEQSWDRTRVVELDEAWRLARTAAMPTTDEGELEAGA